MCVRTLIALFAALILPLCSATAWAELELEIRIDGVSEEELENINAYLEIEKAKDDPELDTQWLERLHRYAPVQIKEAMQPFGYFSTRVESSLTQEGAGWLAVYRVYPGPQTLVTEVKVRVTGEGAEEPRIGEAIAAFPVHEGDVLDGDAYDKGKEELLELIAGLGYAKAKAEVQSIRVNPELNQARIHLEIDTGPKYYLGDLTFKQDVLNQDFLDRYVQVEPGEVYSQERLLSLQSDLIGTRYYSLVDVQPDFDRAENNRVPVDVEMQPANRHKLELGLGYYTDIGPTGSAHWVFRPVNRRGHFTDTLLKLSPVKSTASFGYWIPMRDPRTDNLVFTAKYEIEDSTSQERDTGDLLAGYYFLWRDWDTRLFGELKYETFTTGSQPETDTLMLSWGGSLERTQVESDDPFPTRGNYWRLSLSGSAGLVSDTEYLRAHVKTKHLYPLGERGRLNLRGELGLAGVGDFDLYPSSLRFYAGGDQSVRGYEYQALGPRDDSGEVVGGKNIFTGSVEYDYRFLDQWVAAAFVDAGNAYNDELDKLFYSGGLGVRWLSPIGPVRLDFAVAGNPDEDMDSWRIHLGFGADL